MQIHRPMDKLPLPAASTWKHLKCKMGESGATEGVLNPETSKVGYAGKQFQATQ